jgi:hypothetical protein
VIGLELVVPPAAAFDVTVARTVPIITSAIAITTAFPQRLAPVLMFKDPPEYRKLARMGLGVEIPNLKENQSTRVRQGGFV